MEKYKVNPPQHALEVLNRLVNGGYKAYFVGGCVRNSLMGIAVNDWDICTSSEPWKTAELFADCKIITSGIKHGTVGVIYCEELFEITTFRTEGGYCDSRHPDEVCFVNDIKEDLKRRDFTVNAMAYSPSEGIIDIFGGEGDVKNKIIRAVGCASERFSEDALRILRALRFASVYSFSVEKETAEAIHSLACTLDGISSERIFSELKGIMTGGDYYGVLEEFFDVFTVLFPSLSDNSKNSILSRTKNAANIFSVRLAALLYDTDENGLPEMLNRLKPDKNTVAEIKEIIKEVKMGQITDYLSLKFAVSRLGYERTFSVLCLMDACRKNCGELFEAFEKIKKENPCLSLSALKINGSDLASLGANGKSTGDVLKCLLALVIEGKLENEKNALEDYAKKIIK